MLSYFDTIITSANPGSQLLKALSALTPYLPLTHPSILNFFQRLMLCLLKHHSTSAFKLMSSKNFFQSFRTICYSGKTLEHPQEWICIGYNTIIDLEKSITGQLYSECVITLGNKFKDFTSYDIDYGGINFLKEGTSFENALWLGGMKNQCYQLTRVFDKVKTVTDFKFPEYCQLLKSIREKVKNPFAVKRKMQLMDGYLTLLKYAALHFQRIFLNVMSLPESKAKLGSIQLIFCYIEEVIEILADGTIVNINEIYENCQGFNLQINELKGYYKQMLCNVTIKLSQLQSLILKQILKRYSEEIKAVSEKLLMTTVSDEKELIKAIYEIIESCVNFPKNILGLRKGRSYLILCTISKLFIVNY